MLGAKQENNEMQNAYLSSPPMPRSCKSGKSDILSRLKTLNWHASSRERQFFIIYRGPLSESVNFNEI